MWMPHCNSCCCALHTLIHGPVRAYLNQRLLRIRRNALQLRIHAQVLAPGQHIQQTVKLRAETELGVARIALSAHVWIQRDSPTQSVCL